MSPFTPIPANWIRLLNVRTKSWRVLFLSPATKEKTLIQKPPPRKEAATSLDLNLEADVRGLPSFLQPSEKESLGGSESKPPDRGEDLNSQVVPENGEATGTATEDE